MVSGISLLDLMLNVYKSISRNAHNIQLTVNCIKAADHDRIGIIAYLVGAGNKKSINTVFSAINMVDIVVVNSVFILLGRINKILQSNIDTARKQCNNKQNYQNNLAGLFLLAFFIPCRHYLVNALASCLPGSGCRSLWLGELVKPIGIVFQHLFAAVLIA